MKRGIEMVIGILGILKAGGAYVPLDPLYPASRINLILNDVDAMLILTDGSAPNSFSELTIIDLENNQEEISKCPITPVSSRHNSQNLAYVIYTSGSTGQPKGVMIDQRSVVNLVNGLNERIYHYYGD